MKQYIAWRCDRCNAIFEFDADIVPLRCPDCFSPKEHLHRVGDEDGASEDVRAKEVR